jgi:hypothetical protein
MPLGRGFELQRVLGRSGLGMWLDLSERLGIVDVRILRPKVMTQILQATCVNSLN